eukprot:3602553-Rhodomonas_salina.1
MAGTDCTVIVEERAVRSEAEHARSFAVARDALHERERGKLEHRDGVVQASCRVEEPPVRGEAHVVAPLPSVEPEAVLPTNGWPLAGDCKEVERGMKSKRAATTTGWSCEAVDFREWRVCDS